MPKFRMGSSKPRIVDLRGGRNVPPPRAEEVRPYRERRSQLKIRKQRTRALITAAICVCSLLGAYAIHAVSYFDRFTYQHVSVAGAKSVSPVQVHAFVMNKLAESSRGYISGRNIFVYDYDQLTQEIVAAFPAAKTASVSRDTTLGNGLAVTIDERQGFAQWCSDMGSTCYLLDDTGVVFAPAVGTASSPLLSGYVFGGPLSTSTLSTANPPYGQVFAGEHFVEILELLKKLTDAGLHPAGARMEDDADFVVPLHEDFYLKVSYSGDSALLVKNLVLVLQSEALKEKTEALEYVDLRFGNRVYYKFSSEGEPVTGGKGQASIE
jgi:hypothetical protein